MFSIKKNHFLPVKLTFIVSSYSNLCCNCSKDGKMYKSDPFIKQALALAEQNVAAGGRPFAAIVVKQGEVIATGVNRILQECDPTAHAELLALRAAGKALNATSLEGCSVYASGQPCPMCLAAMRMAGINHLVFAYSNQQAQPYGLSTAHIAMELTPPLEQQSWLSVEQCSPSDANDSELYAKWAEHNASKQKVD